MCTIHTTFVINTQCEKKVKIIDVPCSTIIGIDAFPWNRLGENMYLILTIYCKQQVFR
jgi:hypothetical protein